MQIIDLTHLLNDHILVYPGSEQPSFKQVYTIEKHGFAETKITMHSHNGTHIDAPAHMHKGATTLDKMPLDHFYGVGVVLDCKNIRNQEIQLEDIIRYEESLKEAEFALIETGWSKKWGSADYFKGFPFLSMEALEWLIGFELKGIGIDTISIDEMNKGVFPVHKRILEENMIIVENLTNLDRLRDEKLIFLCMPLKYEEADGSPVRAAAIIGRL